MSSPILPASISSQNVSFASNSSIDSLSEEPTGRSSHGSVKHEDPGRGQIQASGDQTQSKCQDLSSHERSTTSRDPDRTHVSSTNRSERVLSDQSRTSEHSTTSASQLEDTFTERPGSETTEEQSGFFASLKNAARKAASVVVNRDMFNSSIFKGADFKGAEAVQTQTDQSRTSETQEGDRSRTETVISNEDLSDVSADSDIEDSSTPHQERTFEREQPNRFLNASMLGSAMTVLGFGGGTQTQDVSQSELPPVSENSGEVTSESRHSERSSESRHSERSSDTHKADTGVKSSDRHTHSSLTSIPSTSEPLDASELSLEDAGHLTLSTEVESTEKTTQELIQEFESMKQQMQMYSWREDAQQR